MNTNFSAPMGYMRFFPAIVGPGIGSGAVVHVALHGLHSDIYQAIDEPEIVEQIGQLTVRMKLKRHGSVEMVFTPAFCGGDGAGLECGALNRTFRTPNGGTTSPSTHDGGDLAAPEPG